MSDHHDDMSETAATDGPQQKLVPVDGLDSMRVKVTNIVDGFFRFASSRNTSTSGAESDSGRSSPKPSSRSSSPSFLASKNGSSNLPLRPAPLRRPSSRKVKFKDDKAAGKDTDTPDTNNTSGTNPMQALHSKLKAPGVSNFDADDSNSGFRRKKSFESDNSSRGRRTRKGRDSDDDIDASTSSQASWRVHVTSEGPEVTDEQMNSVENLRAMGLKKKGSSTSFSSQQEGTQGTKWFEKYMPNWVVSVRAFCGMIVLNDTFQIIMVLLIMANALCMGLATFDFIDNDPEMDNLFEDIDFVFLCIFTVELGLQFGYWGYQVFTDGWLLFDVLTIGSSWLLDGVQVFRSFRIFRAFRLVVRIPILKSLVYAVFHVIPRISSIMGLFALITYIYAVMATTLYRDYYELYGGADQLIDVDYFGRLDYSIFTLFQFVTLENWAQVVRGYAEHDYFANIIFGSFLTISGFILYSLVVAVVCDSFLMVESKIRAELKAKAKAERERRKSLKRKKGKRGPDDSSMSMSLGFLEESDPAMEELDEKLLKERDRLRSSPANDQRRIPENAYQQQPAKKQPKSFLARPDADTMPDLSVSGYSAFKPTGPGPSGKKMKESAMADLDELLEDDGDFIDDDRDQRRHHTFTTTATKLVSGELERTKPESSQRKRKPVKHRIKKMRRRLDKLTSAQADILSTLDELCKEVDRQNGDQ